MPDLSYAPDFVLVVVAAWLGATVLARTPRNAGSRMFALLSLAVAVWGTAWIVRRLSHSAEVAALAGSVTAVAGALLPALLVHLVLVLAEIRPWGSVKRAVVVLAYVVAIVFGGASALVEGNRAFGSEVRVLGIPGPVLDWSWIVFRIGILALAAWWIWAAQTGRARAHPRPQLLATFGAVLAGALGGGVSIVLDEVGGPSWPGTALLATAILFAAYATFRSDLFFAPEAARRILSYSLGGAITVAMIAIAITLFADTARRGLGLDSPLPTAIALILVLALFDPARAAVLDFFGPLPATAGYRRLMVALGSNAMDAGLGDRLDTVLDELGRSIGCTSLALLDSSGARRAGTGGATEAAHLVIPIEDGGQLLIGPKRSGLPYTPTDWALVQQSSAFIATSLTLDHVTSSQAEALNELTHRRQELRSREVLLSTSLTQATTADHRLDVYALGPLHAEGGGVFIQKWGGPKAGSRQAEGIFAFLFDRGERGARKDDIIELIWPDVDLDRADLAFHRTLGGLRRRLAASARTPATDVITFHHDRYHLNPGLIRWSDIGEFGERLDQAGAANEPGEVLHHLEAARRLYRGDYLDDCPFYGDSSDVEEKRQLLRGRYTDVLLALADAHEQRGDRTGAAGLFREALTVNDQRCVPAEEGLQRLQAAI